MSASRRVRIAFGSPEFQAQRERRTAKRLAVPCPWSNRAQTFWSGNKTEGDIDVCLAAAELTWCGTHERAVSECPPAPATFRPGWGVFTGD